MTRRAIKKSDTVPASEFCDSFIQKMYNSMATSFWVYGKVADAYPHKKDAIASLIVRLVKYCGYERIEAGLAKARAADLPGGGDGNTEWLVDADNFGMIEFMRPAHPNAHYTPTDSNQSPGRVGADGRLDRKHNRDPLSKNPTPLDKLFK